MITGAVRGRGAGDALARHLMKPGNDAVTLVPARGLGSADLAGQIRELVAGALGGRTDRPIYHVHANPDPGIADPAAALRSWWAAFEVEFDLGAQAYCGVVHLKAGRLHEHRVYSLVRPTGAVVDLSWDYARREKCSRIVEREHGMAPVASRHARSIERQLRREGRVEVADWLERAGATTAARPVASLTPTERLQQERTGVSLNVVRRATLAAWRESADGPGFAAALRAHGLDLRRGREGPVIVDASGAAHLTTRVIGAAARRFEGERIRAAAVHARLAGLELEGMHDGRRTGSKARRAGAAAAPDRGGPGAGVVRGGGVGIRRPDRGPGGPDGGGRRRDGGRRGNALGRLRALPAGYRLSLHRRLVAYAPPNTAAYFAAVERARAALERLEAEAAYERERGLALWGLTDIWGLPLR